MLLAGLLDCKPGPVQSFVPAWTPRIFCYSPAAAAVTFAGSFVGSLTAVLLRQDVDEVPGPFPACACIDDSLSLLLLSSPSACHSQQFRLCLAARLVSIINQSINRRPPGVNNQSINQSINLSLSLSLSLSACYVFGERAAKVMDGLWGYNAALTALAVSSRGLY